jgi:uncharacterized protein (TIGR03083 family)
VATDPLEALAGECEGVSRVVLELPEEDFVLPTRCTAWNVKELLGHMFRDVDRTNTALDEPPPAAADTDSVSYWRAYDPVADAPDIADRAKQIAESYGWGSELAVAWDDMWRRALARVEQAERTRIVKTWGPALTMDEFLRTRVLEITVHGLDLADALKRPPRATEEGLEITTEILTGLLRREPPAAVGWDPVTFIDKGTGRSALDDAERASLAALAERFPLLG